MSTYLGIDLSTQGIKAQIIDIHSSSITYIESISFGKDLPEFHSPSGYLVDPNPLVVHADPLMWAAGLDLLFARMKSKGIPLHTVKALSGSGQQHGSVYLNSQFEAVMKGLKQDQLLAPQIEKTLARKTAPIWMDRSTHEECVEMKEKFKDKVQERTGSPVIERFSGPQIRKFYKQKKDEYDQTAYIHLVSSFTASLMLGKSAALDYSDASGTNLFNLHTSVWDTEFVDFTAPKLITKLPALVPSSTILGTISPYFTKYGLTPETQVVAFAGDNPSSLVGTGASEPGTGVISLGTSDTFCWTTKEAMGDSYGHILANPAGGFMSMLCLTNGSLAREKVRNECGVSWQDADKIIMEKSVAGNEGNFLLPYFVAESVPLILNPKPVYFGSEKYVKGEERPEVKLRAILEAQAIRMKQHLGKIDLKRIRVTGGASESKALCQILADVFKNELEKISVADSAALGAALRAASAAAKISLAELYKKFIVPTAVVKPIEKNFPAYEKLLIEYRKAELAHKDI